MWFRRDRPAHEPHREPDMEPFRDGLALLSRDGQTLGYVATSLGYFRTPLSPRTPQAWVWFVVVWADGTKERAVEDYPPWTYVTEMGQGYFDWEGGRNRDRAGRYEIQWVDAELAATERERLGIRSEDF